jgi:bleomycin hydrolase
MIRSGLIAEGRVGKRFEFSTNYLYFFNMLENANRHLEAASLKLYGSRVLGSDERRADLKADLIEGGYFNDFLFLVSKYGLVPKGAMPETVSSKNPTVLAIKIQDSVAATTAELMNNAKAYKTGMARDRSLEIRLRGRRRVWRILETHLGKPPAEFAFRRAGKKTRSYTPRRFADEFVRFDPADYVVLSSYPGKQENALYEGKGQVVGKSAPGEADFERRVLNVGMDRLEALAAKAIEGGQPVLVSGNVGIETDDKTGIMHPGLYDRDSVYRQPPEDAAPPLTRGQLFYFGRFNGGHSVVLVGLDRSDPRKPVVKYLVMNSWGRDAGTKGFYHMYPEWFRRNVFEIVVHKRFLSARERALWRGRALKLGSLY